MMENRTYVNAEKKIVKLDIEHVKQCAWRWFGMKVADENMEKMAELVHTIEHDNKGKKRSRQQMRKLIRSQKLHK